MKSKALVAALALAASLSLATTASADATRDQIEQQGNQRLSQIWQQYQDAENFKLQYQGDHYDEAWQNADTKARALLFEYEQAGAQLSDELHNYDVSQWQQAPQNSQSTSQVGSQSATATQAKMTKATSSVQQDKPTATSQQVKQSANQTPQQSHSETVTTQSDNSSSQSQNGVQAKPAASTKGQLPQTGNAVSWLAPLVGMFGLGLTVKEVNHEEN